MKAVTWSCGRYFVHQWQRPTINSWGPTCQSPKVYICIVNIEHIQGNRYFPSIVTCLVLKEFPHKFDHEVSWLSWCPIYPYTSPWHYQSLFLLRSGRTDKHKVCPVMIVHQYHYHTTWLERSPPLQDETHSNEQVYTPLHICTHDHTYMYKAQSMEHLATRHAKNKHFSAIICSV